MVNAVIIMAPDIDITFRLQHMHLAPHIEHIYCLWNINVRKLL